MVRLGETDLQKSSRQRLQFVAQQTRRQGAFTAVHEGEVCLLGHQRLLCLKP
jgi:hypothetical protein